MIFKRHKYFLKRNKSKHSLKGKIRRYILLSFLTTTFIFIGVIAVLCMKLLNGFSISTSRYISSSIVQEMNSKEFLAVHNLKTLSEFNSNSYKYNDWKINIDRDLSLKILDDIILSTDINTISNKNNTLDETNNNLKLNNKKPHEYPTTTLVEIRIKDSVVYSNLKDYKFTQYSDPDTNSAIELVNPFKYVSSFNLVDENNNVIGTVKSQLNPQLIRYPIILAMLLLIVAFIISFVGALLISWLSSIVIIKPLIQLESKLHAISNEDFEDTLNTQIRLKRPLREIESIAEAANKIMKKMKAYTIQIENQNKTLECQNLELEAQNLELVKSRTQIQKAKQKLQIKEKSVRMLLDNAGQGFLSFGNDLRVHPEYSQECINILGTEVKNESFPKLLYYNDDEQRNFMENVLKRILTEKVRYKKQIYLPLLNDEVNINNKTIHIDYKVINDIDNDNEDDIMVILTDITDKRSLESQIIEERNTLKMVVKVVVNYNDFIDIISDYYRFCRTELNEIFAINNNLREILAIVYREIHTFKGNFSQIYMNKTTSYLHHIESNLEDIKNVEENTTIEDLKLFLEDCCLANLVDEDLGVLKQTLGEDLLKRQDVVLIDNQRLLQIELKMLNILSPFECKTFLPELRSLRYKPLKEFLNSYADYVEKLAGNLNKIINPLIIEGENLLIDGDVYHNFLKSLVHVFRNIIDHAIESPEERVENGKCEYGNICCKYKLVDNNALSLVIKDDGQGINIDKLLMKAVEKNLYTKDEAMNLSVEEILNLIFLDGISTKEDVSYLSGRGIGLAAVRNEVYKLNGKLKVRTKAGEGTEMEFILPYTPSMQMPKISANDILNPLMENCVNFICEELKLPFMASKSDDIKKVEKLELSKYSIFINLKGIIKGKVILSFDETLAKTITHHFIMYETTTEEKLQFIEDAICEFGNITLGNSLNMIPIIQDLLTIEIPLALYSENGRFSCANSQIWTAKLVFQSGTLDLSFSTSDTIMTES